MTQVKSLKGLIRVFSSVVSVLGALQMGLKYAAYSLLDMVRDN